MSRGEGSESCRTWLDTETKALLQHVPPEKLAPPDTGMFTLVILRRKGKANIARVAQVLVRIPRVSPFRAVILRLVCAQPIVSGLSLGEARLWQFELICCDAIAVFLPDGVGAQC